LPAPGGTVMDTISLRASGLSQGRREISDGFGELAFVA